jgi:molybdate transport system substrate-binding protein
MGAGKFVIGLALSLVIAARSDAAQITVVSTNNIRHALDLLVEPYERATGDKVTLESQASTPTRQRIERGDAGDVIIHNRAILEPLVAAGRIQPDSITTIARSSIGVIVRKGEKHPDISSDEKFRQVLLAADSITYPDPAGGSMAGNYLTQLFGRWQIATDLKPKTILAEKGAGAGRVVAAGKASFGLNQTAELMRVPEIEFLAPLPPVLTRAVVMGAALPTNSRDRAAAARWIAFLASPAAEAALRANSMEP